MQSRGSEGRVPAWGEQSALSTRRRGSAWAVSGIVVAATGLTAALIGAVLGVAALLGSGLIYAASQGAAGHGHLFREITRIGGFYVVVPLAVVAVACTVTAWRRTRARDRSRSTTIVATVLTSCLVLVSLVIALIAS
jgi:F0F1-type ATP synthase membrane subunit c/vacuolar-type H+-ATPase subunit K